MITVFTNLHPVLIVEAISLAVVSEVAQPDVAGKVPEDERDVAIANVGELERIIPKSE